MYDDPPAAVTPGWYDDPNGRFEFRYHNGQRWTTDVATGGQRFIDPLGVLPTPSDVVPPRAMPPHVAAVVAPGWQLPAPTARHPARTMAVLSMVFGIIGLALALVPFLFVIGAAGAVAALVLGIMALRRIRQLGTWERSGRGRAIAGIVMAPIALLLCGVGFAFTRVTIREIDDYNDPGPYVLDLDTCTIDHSFATATGTITNGSDRVRDYIIRVEYRERGQVIRTHRVEVTDVQPDAVATWSDGTLVGAVAGADLTCTTRPVTGPFPFDLSPDGAIGG